MKILPIFYNNYHRIYNPVTNKTRFMKNDLFIKSVDYSRMNENKKILNQILNEFQQLDGVEAIGIGGSSASRKTDTSSDIDVYLFTTKDIPIKKREEIIKKYSSNYEVGEEYFGAGDEFHVDAMDKDFDVMYFDKNWMEDNFRNVWLNGNASNGYTTCFLYTLSVLDVKHDKTGWLCDLKSKLAAPYPKKLKANIIQRNMMLLMDKPFASYYEQLKKAVKRNDLNSVNHRTAAFLESYFDIIFAENELLHPGEKRLVNYAKDKCTVLPNDFEQNVNDLVTAQPEEKPEIAFKMVENLREIL